MFFYKSSTMGRKGQYSSSVQCCVGGQGESSGKRGHGGGPTHQLLVAQRGGGHGGGDASLAVVLGQRLQKEPRDLKSNRSPGRAPHSHTHPDAGVPRKNDQQRGFFLGPSTTQQKFSLNDSLISVTGVKLH